MALRNSGDMAASGEIKNLFFDAAKMRIAVLVGDYTDAYLSCSSSLKDKVFNLFTPQKKLLNKDDLQIGLDMLIELNTSKDYDQLLEKAKRLSGTESQPLIDRFLKELLSNHKTHQLK